MIHNTGDESLVASSVGPKSGTEPGLGRIIFERKTTTAELVVFGLCAAAIAFVGFQLSADDNLFVKYGAYGSAAVLVVYA